MHTPYRSESVPESFPCIICGARLDRVMDDAEAQPSDGVMCQTPGNYGSTIHDSMDGEYLCFNICDPCVVRAGEQGRLMTRRLFRLIRVTEGALRNLVVGRERLDRPYIPWRLMLAPDDDVLDMTISELEHLPAHCELTVPLDEIRAMAASTSWSHLDSGGTAPAGEGGE